MNNTVYEALYCSCIQESAFATLSLHWSHEGAEKAVQEHKDVKLREWEALYAEELNSGDENDLAYTKLFPWNFAQEWDIREANILP